MIISVNTNTLNKKASKIENVVKEMNSKMSRANTHINNLTSNWNGTDANAFKNQWDTLTQTKSTYKNMTKELEEYAKFLKNVSEQYKKAQINAINRARRLPK